MNKRQMGMKHVREILRLKHSCCCSNRKIAQSLQISKTTVLQCLKRAAKAGLTWPLSDNLNDLDLAELLYPTSNSVKTIKKQEGLNMEKIHQELKRKGMTLFLLWEEYMKINPNGYEYSYFCELYKRWRLEKKLWMPQIHKAGEKMFVDYAGMTMPIHMENDSIHEAQIFVAVLGASDYTFVEATLSQQLEDWITSHCNAFKYYNGVPEIVIPDNLKSGVTAAHRYEPEENPTYQEMAAHYGTAIMPTRSRKPKDKALVEQTVKQVENQILAPLRNHQFFSLIELNKAIEPLLKKMNEKSFQKISGSRLSQFLEIEKSALKPLPTIPYQFAEWKKVKANNGYMVFFDEHEYSIPYRLVGKPIYVRATQKTLEVFYQNERVASHKRSYQKGGKTILTEHMPKGHQEVAKWTPEKIIEEANQIGAKTKELMVKIMKEKDHIYKATKVCLGIIRLEKHYDKKRLEAACLRALAIGGYSLKSVESILKNGLDRLELSNTDQESITNQCHENIRGETYFE